MTRSSGARGGGVHTKWAERLAKISHSLYVTNFLSDWGARDVKQILNKIGVVMPEKLNKEGKKFAFARFERNARVEDIMEKVKGLSVGNEKLYAHLARFDRSKEGSNTQPGKQKNWYVQSSFRKDDISYLSMANRNVNQVEKEPKVTIGGHMESMEKVQIGKGRDKETTFTHQKGNGQRTMHKDRAVQFLLSKESIAWAKNIFICGLKDGVSARDAVEFLQAKNLNKTRICQLTFDSWILDPGTLEEKEKLMKEDPEWLSLAFSFVRQWRENDCNSQRKVWVEAYGAPLHV